MNVPDTAHKLCALVVDDYVDCAESTALLLQLAGYQAEVACDGPEAIEMAARHNPSVILLDLDLPGMNGYEVARRIRDNHVTKHLLIAAVTGYGRDEDKRRSTEAGIDLHLVKPVDPKCLLALLRKFQNNEIG